MELIAQCLSNIESDPSKNQLLNALSITNKSICDKINEAQNSLSIMNSQDLKQQSKQIINSIQNTLHKIQLKTNNNYQIENEINPEIIKQIDLKLSNIDLQTKVLNEGMQQIHDEYKQMNCNQTDNNKLENLHTILENNEDNIFNKITKVLPDIIANIINNSSHNQQNYDNALNIENIDNKLSKITDQMSLRNSELENEMNINVDLLKLEQELQNVQQIVKENNKNNLFILNKLSDDNQRIQSQLDEIQDKLSTQQPIFTQQQQNPNNTDSDKLSTNIFLNRINAMEERFESQLAQISEQQTNFQKCVLEQLNQLISNNDTKKLKAMQLSQHQQPRQSTMSQEEQQNNLSLWMTVQEIDHNTKEANREIKLLKEQQIAQYESITNALFRQRETLSSNVRLSNTRLSNRETRKRTSKYPMPLMEKYESHSSDIDSYYDKHHRESSISQKYRESKRIESRPIITNHNENNNGSSISIDNIDCDNINDWNKMNNIEKQQLCNSIMKKLFSKELYEHTVEPRNSFYLQFAKKLIEDWKKNGKWNDNNWELMDEKKQLISKIWSFMLLNWDECTGKNY